MRLVFDIDGTICTQEEDYKNAKPIYEVIEKINRHYKDGDFIILQTARGTMTGINWVDVTTNQLAEWGVKYDELHFGKPAGDIYIDDKAINVQNWEADIDGKPIYKIWGTEYLLTCNKHYAMKRLNLAPNKHISLQYHEQKHETWHIVDGFGVARLGMETFDVFVGDTIDIPSQTIHQIKAGDKGLVLIESSTTELNDIVRLEV